MPDVISKNLVEQMRDKRGEIVPMLMPYLRPELDEVVDEAETAAAAAAASATAADGSKIAAAGSATTATNQAAAAAASAAAAVVNVQAVVDPFDGFNARLSTSRRRPVRLVSIGSSTTSGNGASITPDRWVNVLTRQLQNAYPSGVPYWEPPVGVLPGGTLSLVPGVHMYNGGISGATSATYCDAGVVTNIDAINPDIVFHMIGANDYSLGTSPATVKNNILAAMAAIDAVVTGVLHIVCDTYARPDVNGPASPWSAYVTAMQDAANQHPGEARFVSQLGEWVAAGASGYDPVDALRLTEWRLSAGIHPSDAGHRLIATNLAQTLRVPQASSRREDPIAFDRFGRVALGNTETGQPWALQGAAVLVPQGGKLGCTTAGNAVIDIGFSDCEVGGIVTMSTAVVMGFIQKSADANTRLGFYLNGPSDRAEFYDGASILDWGGALSLVNGADYFLMQRIEGNQMTAFVNGVKVKTITLSGAIVAARAASTLAGVRCNTANATAKFKHFYVRAL